MAYNRTLITAALPYANGPDKNCTVGRADVFWGSNRQCGLWDKSSFAHRNGLALSDLPRQKDRTRYGRIRAN